jgi:alcohol dehydrogenase
MDRIGGPLEVRDVPDRVPSDDGVVVEVHATGLCRSDWHAWAGHDDVTLPHVPGHELAGVITALGARVTGWAWCLSGNAQVCPVQEQPGFTHWGSFAESVALYAADANLVAIPQAVPMGAAASLGCRFATAYRALVGRARLAAGEWVTVVGAGGMSR